MVNISCAQKYSINLSSLTILKVYKVLAKVA